MANILSIVSIVSFIVAGISLALAIFLGINFKIPKIIGDLSGRTAKKSIAKMRASNEISGQKSYHPGVTKINHSMFPDTMPNLEGQNKQDSNLPSLDKEQADSIEMFDVNVTELLLDSDETELLEKDVQVTHKTKKKKIQMLDEIIYTHTDEVIE